MGVRQLRHSDSAAAFEAMTANPAAREHMVAAADTGDKLRTPPSGTPWNPCTNVRPLEARGDPIADLRRRQLRITARGQMLLDGLVDAGGGVVLAEMGQQ